MSKIFNVHRNFDKTTFLKDIKTSATDGGSFTAGSYVTRTLNTQEGDTSFCSLSSNQFTLIAGTYIIEASVPGADVQEHKAKIRNITDSSDVIIGQSARTSNDTVSGELNTSISCIFGTVTITSSKVFELQHRCSATDAGGFGIAGGFGDSEVYTVVKIRKIG